MHANIFVFHFSLIRELKSKFVFLMKLPFALYVAHEIVQSFILQYNSKRDCHVDEQQENDAFTFYCLLCFALLSFVSHSTDELFRVNFDGVTRIFNISIVYPLPSDQYIYQFDAQTIIDQLDQRFHGVHFALELILPRVKSSIIIIYNKILLSYLILLNIPTKMIRTNRQHCTRTRAPARPQVYTRIQCIMDVLTNMLGLQFKNCGLLRMKLFFGTNIIWKVCFSAFFNNQKTGFVSKKVIYV